jgi:hypothetical protein
MNPVFLEDFDFDKTYQTYATMTMSSDYSLCITINDQDKDFMCYSLPPNRKGWEYAENIISALNCWEKHTKLINGENIKSKQNEVDRLTNIVKEWQNWWNENGFNWYKEGRFPQEQKPNFLKSDSPFYNEWIS